MSKPEGKAAYRPKLPELEFVRYRVEDRIAYIMLDRPEKLNAISDQVVAEIRQVFQYFDLDPDAFVAILHGAGRAFTSGADVNQRQLRPREELESFGLWSPDTRRRDLWFDFVNWKPMISAAHGYVMGMGVGLCLSADLVIATASTKFQITEVGRGLHGSTLWALLRYRGAGAFADEIGLTGRMFTGEEAAQHGIITRATRDGEHLKVAEDFARQLLKNPPLAVRAGVRSRRMYMLENQRLSFLLTEQSPALYLTKDFHEAAKAFVEKRPPPRFEGR